MEKVINVLLIEDDPLDQIQVRRALDKKGVLYKLDLAENGEEAMHLLQKKASSSSSEIPHIILLDISMPKMNGVEFLREFRKNDAWSDVKVFVLTNIEHEKTVSEDAGISGYIVKPLTFNSPSLDTITLMIDMMNVKA